MIVFYAHTRGLSATKKKAVDRGEVARGAHVRDDEAGSDDADLPPHDAVLPGGAAGDAVDLEDVSDDEVRRGVEEEVRAREPDVDGEQVRRAAPGLFSFVTRIEVHLLGLKRCKRVSIL